jgi:hypothetical protein
MTDTHSHTDTDTRTPIFYCFIVFRDLNNVKKNHKKWGYEKKNIFRMHSILRYSNASRSKNQKTAKHLQIGIKDRGIYFRNFKILFCE